MKYLTLVVFFLVCTMCFAQNKTTKYKPNKSVKSLTELDRKIYTLSINQNKVSRAKYSLSDNYNDHRAVLLIPILFTNYSNDTLKYLSMSCSWEEFYVISKGIVARIAGWPCDSNFPTVRKISPHKSVALQLPVIRIKSDERFKIGIVLIKMDNSQSPFYFSSLERHFVQGIRATT